MKQMTSAALAATILFVSAGRLNLPFFWVYLFVLSGTWAVGRLVIDPELLKERARPMPGGQDRNLPGAAGLLILIHQVFAGLDVGRYHWSDSVPVHLQVVGVLCMFASMALTLWAMRVNRFFSPVVRLQSERGHQLICAGPYRFVRHPGYLATCLWFPASGLALGSWLSFVPLVLVLSLALRRVAIEDRFLHQELEGYSDYARRVPHRLIPRPW